MLLIDGEGFRAGSATVLNKTGGMILPGPEAAEWFSLGLSWGFGGITVLLWLQKTKLLLLITVLPSSSENMILCRNGSASSKSLPCAESCLQGLIHQYFLSFSEPRFGHIPEGVVMEGVGMILAGPALCLQAAQRFFLYMSHSFLYEIINPCVIQILLKKLKADAAMQ